MKRVLYLDQNAWIALLRGAQDREAYPAEQEAHCRIAHAVQAGSAVAPLSYSAIYETLKINDPQRRFRLSDLQTTLSQGIVLRSRSHIFQSMLTRYLQERLKLPITPLTEGWFLSDVFIEAVLEYRSGDPHILLGPEAVEVMRQNPAGALHRYLTQMDDMTRRAGIRYISAHSAELLARMEARRQLAAGETFPTRLRIYRAQLFYEQLEPIFAVGRSLGLAWREVLDIGPSLVKGMTREVAVMRTECELAARLEDQQRNLTENDLRDMLAFAVALPLCDIMVAEKPFTATARQAKLGEMYSTTLLTSVADVTDHMLQGEVP